MACMTELVVEATQRVRHKQNHFPTKDEINVPIALGAYSGNKIIIP